MSLLAKAPNRIHGDMRLRSRKMKGKASRNKRERLQNAFLRDMGWKRWDVQSKNIFNFLMSASMNTLSTDIVLDLGAGQCRYKPFFEHARYIGVDFAKGSSKWDYSKLDVIADISEIPFRDESVDVAINTVTMEHVNEPQKMLKEIYRILKPDGNLFLYAPMAYPEHQIPFDYFRYTKYGLKYLFEKAGFEVKSISPSNGSFYTGAVWAAYPLQYIRNKFLRIAGFALFKYIIRPIANRLDGLDRDRNFPLVYVCYVQKRGRDNL